MPVASAQRSSFRLNGQIYRLVDQALLSYLRDRFSVLVPPEALQPWQRQEIPITEGDYGEERTLEFLGGHEGFGDSDILEQPTSRYEYALGGDLSYFNYYLPGPLQTDITLTGNTANCDTIFEASSDESAPSTSNTFMYAGGGTRIHKFNNGADTIAETVVHPQAVTGWVKWKQATILGQGTGAGARRMTNAATPPTADTWTTLAAAVVSGGFGKLADRLWVKNGGSTVRNVLVTDDETANASYSGSFQVGDSSSQIRQSGLVGLARVLYSGKDDGMWSLDQFVTAKNVTPDLAAYWSNENGREAQVWDGSIWFCSLRGLVEYYPGKSRFDSVAHAFVANRSPVQGRPTAIIGAGDWLYVAVYNETNTYILKGRRKKAHERGGEMIWQVISGTIAAEVRVLYLATKAFANPRVYFGRGVNLSYFILPRGERFPTLDTNTRYATSTTFYLGTFWGNPATYKNVRSISIANVVDASTTRYIEPQYLLDGGAATAFDEDTATSNRITGTGFQSKYALDTNANAKTAIGRRIEFRLVVTSDSNSNPVEFQGPVIVRLRERPDRAARYTAWVYLSNDRNYSAAEALTNLRDLVRDPTSTTTVVTLIREADPDILGPTGVPVVVESVEEVASFGLKARPQKVAKVVMVDAPTS